MSRTGRESSTRRTRTVRAEAARVVELGCGVASGGERGRRVDAQLGCAEALGKPHGPAATRTAPAGPSGFAVAVGAGARGTDASDQPAAQPQQVAALGVRQKAEVANAVEAAGQHMQQEAAQELVKRERQQPLLVAVGRITPTEGDLALLERDQALVRDRHTVGVATQIRKRPPRSSEGRPYFDHPLVAVQGPHKGLEVARSIERREPPVEAQLACGEGFVETVDELTAKDLGENLLGQKEVLRGCVDPTAVVE